MHSSTSSEGSQLVRIVVPCAQTRVAIETHSRVKGTKCRAFREASKARGKVCSLSQPDGKFNVRAEQERCCYTVSSSSCSWPAVRSVVYAIIAQVQSSGATFICVCALYMLLVAQPCILFSTLSHDCDIKHTCYVYVYYVVAAIIYAIQCHGRQVFNFMA